MTAIRAQLEVGLAHPQNADWPTTASDVLKDVARMQRLVDQLLVLAHADEGALTPGDQLVDLDELVLREARRARETDRLAVDARAVSATRVRGHADQLHQVVRNLVDNACRHARGAITLSLQADGASAVLKVADDGPGIPPERREQVFERFSRLDDARGSNDGGSGLGLAITREIVVAHRGTISVENAGAGGGALLVVRLPLDGS
jgi:signal transduction histidine kinase